MAVIREEEIHEALDEVVACFRGGKVEIRSLCWRGRHHVVTQMHASWIIVPCIHRYMASPSRWKQMI